MGKGGGQIVSSLFIQSGNARVVSNRGRSVTVPHMKLPLIGNRTTRLECQQTVLRSMVKPRAFGISQIMTRASCDAAFPVVWFGGSGLAEALHAVRDSQGTRL